MTRPTAAPPPWHRAALAKFYQLQSEAAGLRGSMIGADDRLATIRADRRAAESRLQKLREALYHLPVMPGRQADADRTQERIAESEHELDRLAMLEGEATEARDHIAAAIGALTPLLNAAGAMMVRLRLVTREEAGQ